MRYSAASLLTVALCFAVSVSARSADQEILVMSSSEEADGVTQADLNMPALKMLEKRTVQQLQAKMRSYLRAHDQPTQLPKFEVESHYIDAEGTRLAIVRVRSPKAVNQVFIYGIQGDVFLRVACVRTRNFDQSIPVFYGPCGDKLREVFNVAVAPK